MKISPFKIKNVVGYGNGTKRKGGIDTGEDAIVFFVKEKTENISEEDRIPAELDGKKTDVIETGSFSIKLLQPSAITTHTKNILPLRGGIQIQPEGMNIFGTLGFLAKDRISGKILGVTNAHVAGNPLVLPSYVKNNLIADGTDFTDSSTANGLNLYQSTEAGGSVVGSVFKDKPLNYNIYNTIDASLFSIKPEAGITAGILSLTKYPQTFMHPDSVPFGHKVYKSGRTTGVTDGELISKDATVTVDIGESGDFIYMSNQLIVYKDDGTFAEGGDSGSAICIDIGQGKVSIVGLLSSAATSASGSSTTSCVRIDELVNQFDIVPWDGSIIAEESDTLASTGFGSVYSNSGISFFDTTNSYLCASGESLTSDLLRCIDGNIQLSKAEHTLYSGKRLYGWDKIPLEVKDKFKNADVSISCPIGATLFAKEGVRLSSKLNLNTELNTAIQIEEAVSALIPVPLTIKVTSQSSKTNADNVSCSCPAVISLNLESECSINTPIYFSANPALDINLEADVVEASGYTLSISMPINLFIELDVNTQIIDSTSHTYSDINQSVYDEAETLMYKGGCL